MSKGPRKYTGPITISAETMELLRKTFDESELSLPMELVETEEYQPMYKSLRWDHETYRIAEIGPGELILVRRDVRE